MPFMTDDIYKNYLNNNKFIIEEEWPINIAFNFIEENFQEIEGVIKIVTACRNIKASLKIDPKKIIEVFSVGTRVRVGDDLLLFLFACP